MEESIAIIGSLFVIPALVLTMVIFLRRYTHEERLKALETGMKLTDLKVESNGGRFMTLRFALLFIGVGIGILGGGLLDAFTGLKPPVGYFSMIFIFSGIGLVSAYLIESKNQKKEED